MKTQINPVADAQSLDALARFLAAFEKISPAPIRLPKAIRGKDNVIYVEVGYHTEEDTFLVGN
jgi:hypothetical protein